jgi:hypothetical protein
LKYFFWLTSTSLNFPYSVAMHFTDELYTLLSSGLDEITCE